MAQNVIAYINAQIASMAAAEGRPLTDLPTHITKEYLQANPYYYQMFRKQMAQFAAQQAQQGQQGGQPTPPQQSIRPNIPQNVRPAVPGNIPPILQQLQATGEDIALVQQYCRLMEVQLQGYQDARLPHLIAKAKSGELKALMLARLQQLNAQQSTQNPMQNISAPANIGAQLANLPPHEKQRLLEMLQRPRVGALNGQQNMVRPGMPVMSPSPAVRPNPQLGATQAQSLQQQRPVAAMMNNLNPAAGNPAMMTAAQQQLLQRFQQMQQAQQALQQQQAQTQQTQQTQQPQPAATNAAPRPPAANVASILQQLSSGQINAAVLPPSLIVFVKHELPKTPRFQHTMEIFNGQMCVFGGKGPGIDTNLTSFVLDYQCVDITKSINQANPKWRLQSSASQFAMPPLAQHTTVYNRYNHVIVPFGGQSPVGFSKAINLAVYCTLFQAWGASNVVDRDARRYVHTSVLQEKSGDMVIFGGASDDTTAGGDSQGSRWLQVNRLILDNERHNANQRQLGNPVANNTKLGMILHDNGDSTPSNISGVIHHSSVLLNDTQMVVLGGDVYDGKAAVMQPFNAVYIYDIDTMKWRKQKCTGDVPPSRCVFSASEHKQNIYIFGGVNVTTWSDFYNDLYALDTLTWTWRKMPAPNAPAPRYAHQMKTLGDYLVITHGYIQHANGTYGGDPDIYFYDLNKKTFVSKYSPDGISKKELDVEWREQRTGKTNAI
ncbi:Leucine-zipper-like transcriptional regulator 1, partial [Coemansia brasiliensis]